jgi:phage protein D
MEGNSRRAQLQVHYDNVDISTDIQSHLKSWSYTDNLSGEADDLQITLEDMDHLWRGDWMPDKGAILSAKVIRENWDEVGNKMNFPSEHLKLMK